MCFCAIMCLQHERVRVVYVRSYARSLHRRQQHTDAVSGNGVAQTSAAIDAMAIGIGAAIGVAGHCLSERLKVGVARMAQRRNCERSRRRRHRLCHCDTRTHTAAVAAAASSACVAAPLVRHRRLQSPPLLR